MHKGISASTKMSEAPKLIGMMVKCLDPKDAKDRLTLYNLRLVNKSLNELATDHIFKGNSTFNLGNTASMCETRATHMLNASAPMKRQVRNMKLSAGAIISEKMANLGWKKRHVEMKRFAKALIQLSVMVCKSLPGEISKLSMVTDLVKISYDEVNNMSSKDKLELNRWAGYYFMKAISILLSHESFKNVDTFQIVTSRAELISLLCMQPRTLDITEALHLPGTEWPHGFDGWIVPEEYGEHAKYLGAAVKSCPKNISTLSKYSSLWLTLVNNGDEYFHTKGPISETANTAIDYSRSGISLILDNALSLEVLSLAFNKHQYAENTFSFNYKLSDELGDGPKHTCLSVLQLAGIITTDHQLACFISSIPNLEVVGLDNIMLDRHEGFERTLEALHDLTLLNRLLMANCRARMENGSRFADDNKIKQYTGKSGFKVYYNVSPAFPIDQILYDAIQLKLLFSRDVEGFKDLRVATSSEGEQKTEISGDSDGCDVQ